MKSARRRRAARELRREYPVFAEIQDDRLRARRLRRSRRGRWAVTDGYLYVRGRSLSELRAVARAWGRGTRVVRHRRGRARALRLQASETSRLHVLGPERAVTISATQVLTAR